MDATEGETPLDRHGNQVVAEAGDGAQSPEELYIDRHAYDEGYVTTAATTIGYANQRDERYQRLQEYNEGIRGDSRHGARMSRLDKRRATQALCSALDLPAYQQRMVVDYMLDLDLSLFGSQKRIEKVALVVIRHVVEREWFEQNPTDPERLSERDRYLALVEEQDMDMGDVMRISQIFKRWLTEHAESRENYGVGFPGRDPNLPPSERSIVES